MSTAAMFTAESGQGRFPGREDLVPLVERAEGASQAAQEYLLRVLRGDHWRAELESHIAVTAEYVLLAQALGLHLSDDRREAIRRYLFARQKANGSWGLAFNHPGDVSSTAETYLALRILGMAEDDERMRKAQRYIRGEGGLEKVRVFTRIHLALFGLFPWEAVPSLPPEFILLPSWAPVNIYRLSSWARGTVVPLLVVFHHRPVYALPNGRSPQNDWLDHLWLDPAHKNIPYRCSVVEALRRDGPSWTAFFGGVDELLQLYERAPEFGMGRWLRDRSLRLCEKWVLEHQETTGDWGGIFPPMMNGVLALHLQGHALDSDPMRRGLAAIEAFGWEDSAGFRMEACQSPVWDSALALIALSDARFDGNDPRLLAVRRWLEAKQLTNDWGDWKVYNPKGRPGGWSFEHCNTWYPDVDDTAAVLLALLKQDPSSRHSEVVRRGADWMVSMQNRDGGFAAFDVENDREFLNRIPFSDMDSLCDPSSPDVTGRVLEALGVLREWRHHAACHRAIDYLRRSQEKEGSWFGRWGVNYVYGTSHVLNGLARQGVPAADRMVERGLRWLESVQNPDGGFGECLESYRDRSLMGCGSSTASQTAWGLMGLLAYLPPDRDSVKRAVAFLVERQLAAGEAAGSWSEEEFTGTGFPRHFYLRYHLYRHYFPLMALGRFCAAARE
ncbi:MAG TPA: squalene--hopene cyclase [Anaeromyxobacteraceae bacterium]|nr:squalene--hopene cyclase [Anaeromyxobacteraceae bacterium]